MRKKILYILQSGKLGGAEISTLLLLRHLNRERLQPIVLGPAGGELESRLGELNIELIHFNLPRIKSKNPARLLFSGFILLVLSIKIYWIIKKQGISLVHTVSNKRSAIFGILAARFARIPVVWSIRNLQWEGWIDSWLIKNATKLIAVSEAIHQQFNRMPRYRHKFVTIHNAADLADFKPELNAKRPLLKKWGLKKSDFIVAMVGRLTPEKGQEQFIEAAAQISKLESDITFLIIGEQNFYGDDRFYRSLVEKSRRLGLNSRLKFIDFEADIAAVMGTIDLLVLFSVYESFGRVLIEAMAMEKPVIATDCGGPGEIVLDQRTGILLKNRDVSALTDAILFLYHNPEAARRMGRVGRKRVQKYFSVEQYAVRHQTLYQEILN